MATRRIAKLDQHTGDGAHTGGLPGKLESYSPAGTGAGDAGGQHTFKVVWKAQDGLPLNYLLRVEQGKGPLALLELKNFRLPGQVFLTGKSMKDVEEYGGRRRWSELLQKLTRSCFADRDALDVARTQAALSADMAAAGDGRYAGRGRPRLPRRFSAYPRRDEQTFRRGYEN